LENQDRVLIDFPHGEGAAKRDEHGGNGVRSGTGLAKVLLSLKGLVRLAIN